MFRLAATRSSTLFRTTTPSVAYYSSSSTLDAAFDKIACIGTGKMAQAMLKPMIEQGVQPANQIQIYDVSLNTMESVAEKFGVQTASSIPELVADADLVLCCVKPQNLTPAFFQEVRKGGIDNTILLSILAGKSIDVFQQGGFTKVVRSMPNTPATIGQGMTVWSCTPNLDKEERKQIRNILSTCGKSVRECMTWMWLSFDDISFCLPNGSQMYVDDESFIDMATSISGSGPAYIFMVRY